MTSENHGDPPMKALDIDKDSLVALLIAVRKRYREQEQRPMYDSTMSVVNINETSNKNTTVRVRHCQARFRGKREKVALDRTLHTSSFAVSEALNLLYETTIAICKEKEVSDTDLLIAHGNIDEKFANSFQYHTFTSIDLSNMTPQSEYFRHSGAQQNLTTMCMNIARHGSSLETLCLHNCHVDDACIMHITLLIESKSNRLSTLNLSKNKISESGVQLLLRGMKSKNCIIRELDLSQNCLTISGITLFAQNLPKFVHLNVLRLSDSEHLIPLSMMQQFTKALENNYGIHTLTLGNEVMDGSKADICNKKDIDEVLRCWWYDPEYVTIVGHIRMLLRLNYAGLGELIQKNPNLNTAIDILQIQHIINTVKSTHHVEAWFHILRLKPDALLKCSKNESI